ncbi:hypothetical protein AX774_g6028 [Zancudomyces culisetae]|uniref:Uncharacterized protein n=1 Tax=Zancudomyces culisetae TaxID=1213189 RepID=A0A1R1PHT1_ZANCU|nr:hypothetical protein AX774_g6028 [Zancudomyces culisetae]|eukprot:OMH80534.1 hypothetical protein AX774_g6028 [Zancudomyces culisetae]
MSNSQDRNPQDYGRYIDQFFIRDGRIEFSGEGMENEEGRETRIGDSDLARIREYNRTNVAFDNNSMFMGQQEIDDLVLGSFSNTRGTSNDSSVVGDAILMDLEYGNGRRRTRQQVEEEEREGEGEGEGDEGGEEERGGSAAVAAERERARQSELYRTRRAYELSRDVLRSYLGNTQLLEESQQQRRILNASVEIGNADQGSSRSSIRGGRGRSRSSRTIDRSRGVGISRYGIESRNRQSRLAESRQLFSRMSPSNYANGVARFDQINQSSSNDRSSSDNRTSGDSDDNAVPSTIPVGIDFFRLGENVNGEEQRREDLGTIWEGETRVDQTINEELEGMSSDGSSEAQDLISSLLANGTTNPRLVTSIVQLPANGNVEVMNINDNDNINTRGVQELQAQRRRQLQRHQQHQRHQERQRRQRFLEYLDGLMSTTNLRQSFDTLASTFLSNSAADSSFLGSSANGLARRTQQEEGNLTSASLLPLGSVSDSHLSSNLLDPKHSDSCSCKNHRSSKHDRVLRTFVHRTESNVSLDNSVSASISRTYGPAVAPTSPNSHLPLATRVTSIDFEHSYSCRADVRAFSKNIAPLLHYSIARHSFATCHTANPRPIFPSCHLSPHCPSSLLIPTALLSPVVRLNLSSPNSSPNFTSAMLKWIYFEGSTLPTLNSNRFSSSYLSSSLSSSSSSFSSSSPSSSSPSSPSISNSFHPILSHPYTIDPNSSNNNSNNNNTRTRTRARNNINNNNQPVNHATELLIFTSTAPISDFSVFEKYDNVDPQSLTDIISVDNDTQLHFLAHVKLREELKYRSIYEVHNPKTPFTCRYLYIKLLRSETPSKYLSFLNRNGARTQLSSNNDDKPTADGNTTVAGTTSLSSVMYTKLPRIYLGGILIPPCTFSHIQTA